MHRLRGVRWSFRGRLAEHPRLYLPIARRKFPDAVLGPDTELVIEGFTRSAVTFATIAFQLAQRRPVRLAHTLHAVGHVTAAVEHGIPCLVTIREPEEVALSTVVREPYITLDRALVAYAHFYEAIQPFVGNIVVGRFRTIVDDFGVVIGKINERFDTSFDLFERSADNVARCYQVIEDRARRPPWERDLGRFQAGMITYEAYRAAAERDGGSSAGRPVPEHRVQRPSTARDAMKDALRAQLADPRLDAARAVAHVIYERLVASAI